MSVAEQVLARLSKSTKRSVVCFLGIDKPGLAPTLRAAAEMAAGKKLPEEKIAQKKVQGRVEALYSGGTLCSEAELIFRRRGLEVGMRGHRFIDLGDDQYTRGRPHPMIDPEIRNDRLATALADPLVGVILVDVVLGYGAHRDPAGVLAREDLAQKTVIASVVGTEADPQVRSLQVARGPVGRWPGRTKPMIPTVIMYMVAARRPGTMPAMNSLPMSCSVMIP